MGYYHVNRILKGFILNEFDVKELLDTIPDMWLPDQLWLSKYYPETDGCGYEGMTKAAKLILLGCLEEMPYLPMGPRQISEVDEQIALEIYEEEYARKDLFLHALAVIYCFINGYPVSAFECLRDYDDTWMFVCAVEFPPEEYNEKLAKLTEDSMAEELSEFLTTVTGEEYEPVLEWCEEYIKE